MIALLRDIWSKPDPPTVGVVTFNKKQEARIEEIVARQAQVDREFRALVERETERKDNNKDVGFFIKNLESVQGDERDVIIFSTTFGPSERGRVETFRRTFGPLTQSGGERRLNVAVTRARQGILVVTSMPFDRISDCQQGVEPGRHIKARDFLQVYLTYAQAMQKVGHAIRTEGGADAVNLKVAEEYVAAFGNLAKQGNTLIVPGNLSEMSSMIATALQIVKQQRPSA